MRNGLHLTMVPASFDLGVDAEQWLLALRCAERAKREEPLRKVMEMAGIGIIMSRYGCGALVWWRFQWDTRASPHTIVGTECQASPHET